MISLLQWIISRKQIQSHLTDLGSLNAIWSWVVMVLFCWGFIHIVRNGTEQAVSTAFTVFGGVASIVLTGHIAAKTYKDVKGSEDPGASD